MKRYLLVAVAILTSCILHAQTRITGVVTSDEDGQPLIGVAVTVKGTFTGVTTDVDGSYSIALPKSGEAVLVFSYLGYKNE